MNYFVAAAVPTVCLFIFVGSRFINRAASADRDSSNSLVVLSGMLAALAILIPLGAALLPDRNFAWQECLLVGTLISGVVCIFGTVFSMIKLQKTKTFKPNEYLYVPGWINATWISLGLMAFAIVVVKSLPVTKLGSIDSGKATTQARFVVMHDLPVLGTRRQAIEIQWGTPALEKNSELLYQTKDGVIVFCLDPKGIIQSITEAKETEADAVGPICK